MIYDEWKYVGQSKQQFLQKKDWKNGKKNYSMMESMNFFFVAHLIFEFVGIVI